jgi:membrane protease subunit (stomatin/prohibitin family)
MFGSMKSQLRSVIEWSNPAPDVLFEKWSGNGDEIKNASQLIVGPGQGCIFVYQGKVQAVYTEPGMVSLNTANIPFWTTITKFMQAFVSEHKVGLYFYKTSQLVDVKWGTASVIKYEDPKYKFPVGLRAFGNFSMVIQKPESFFQNIMGARDAYLVDEIKDVLTARMIQPLANLFAQAKFTFTEIDSNRSEVSLKLRALLDQEFTQLGFSLTDFRIEGTSFDEDTMKRINRIADMTAESQAANSAGVSYAQLQQLEAMKEAAKNPGGAGMIMGIGVGSGLGQGLAGGIAGIGNGDEDPTLKLRKLKEMVTQGLITAEEYEVKKKEILSKF